MRWYEWVLTSIGLFIVYSIIGGIIVGVAERFIFHEEPIDWDEPEPWFLWVLWPLALGLAAIITPVVFLFLGIRHIPDAIAKKRPSRSW